MALDQDPYTLSDNVESTASNASDPASPDFSPDNFLPKVQSPIHQRNYDPQVEAAVQARDQAVVAGQQAQNDTQRRAVNRYAAKDLAERGIPATPEWAGDVKPVLDAQGQPLNNYIPTARLAWDSQGNPQQVNAGPNGTVNLSDPMAGVPDFTDPKSGDIYKRRAGLPDQWVGKDDQIASQAQEKAVDSLNRATATAMGGPISAENRDFNRARTELKGASNQLFGSSTRPGLVQPPLSEDGVTPMNGEQLSALDPDTLKQHIDDQFNAEYSQPAANAKGWFSDGLTEDAAKVRADIDKRKEAAMQAAGTFLTKLDKVNQHRNNLQSLQDQREGLQGDRMDSINAQRVAVGLAPVTIPGQEQTDLTPTPSPEQPIAEQPQIPPELAQIIADAQAGNKLYKIDEKGSIDFTATNQPLKALMAARDDGLIDPEKAREIAPRLKEFQDAVQKREELVAKAGGWSAVKAAGLNVASTGVGMLAAPAGAGIGAEIGGAIGGTIGGIASGIAAAPTGPGEVLAIPAGVAGGAAIGSTIGGFIGGAAAFIGGEHAFKATIKKIGQYSETIDSLNASDELHPVIGAVTGLATMAVGNPEGLVKAIGGKLTGSAEALAKASSVPGETVSAVRTAMEAQQAATRMGTNVIEGSGDAAKVVNITPDLKAKAAVVLDTVGKSYANSGGGIAKTYDKLSEMAKIELADGKSAGQAAATVAKQVFGSAAAMVAMDSMLRVATGQPLTLEGAGQAALIGAMMSGHGLEAKGYDDKATGTIAMRMMVHEKTGTSWSEPVKVEDFAKAGIDISKIDSLQMPEFSRGLTAEEQEIARKINQKLGELAKNGNVPVNMEDIQLTARQMLRGGRTTGVAAVDVRPGKGSEPTGKATPAPKPAPAGVPQLTAPETPKVEAPIIPGVEQPPAAQIPAKEAPVGVPAAEEAQTPATLSEPIADALKGDNVRHDMSDANTHYFTDLKTGLPFTVPDGQPVRDYRLALAKVRTAAKQSATSTSDEQVTTPPAGGETPTPEAPATDAAPAERGAPGEAPVAGTGVVHPQQESLNALESEITAAEKAGVNTTANRRFLDVARATPTVKPSAIEKQREKVRLATQAKPASEPPPTNAAQSAIQAAPVTGAAAPQNTIESLRERGIPTPNTDRVESRMRSLRPAKSNEEAEARHDSLEKAKQDDIDHHQLTEHVRGMSDSELDSIRESAKFTAKSSGVPKVREHSAKVEKAATLEQQRRAKEGTPSPAAPAPAVAETAPEAGIGSVYQGQHGGQSKWMVQRSEKRGFGDEIHDTKEAAEKSGAIESRQHQERQARKQREIDDQAAETAAQAERGELNGFGAELTPLHRAGVVKRLSEKLNFKGTGVITRRDLIRKLVADGRNVETEDGVRILVNDKGEFLNEKTLSKTGIDYAEYLIAQRDSKAPAPAFAAPATPEAAPQPAPKPQQKQDPASVLKTAKEVSISFKPDGAQKATHVRVTEKYKGKSIVRVPEDFKTLQKGANSWNGADVQKVEAVRNTGTAKAPVWESVPGELTIADRNAPVAEKPVSVAQEVVEKPAAAKPYTPEFQAPSKPDGNPLMGMKGDRSEGSVERYKQAKAEYDKNFEAWVASIPENKAIVFQNGKLFAAVTRDPKGGWRVTNFSGELEMPMGHNEFKTRLEAAQEVSGMQRIDKLPFTVKAGEFHSQRTPDLWLSEPGQEPRLVHFGGYMKGGETAQVIDFGGRKVKDVPIEELGKGEWETVNADHLSLHKPAKVTESTGNAWNSATPTIGSTATGTYALHEASNLVTSDKPDYDQSLQPRDRSRQASKDQIAKLALEWQPQRTGESLTTDLGSPLIDNRNHVLSGNGRTMARRILSDAKEAEYRHWLKENAEKFGIDPTQIDSMKLPTLVRVVQDFGGITPQAFAEDSNKHQVLGMSDAEKATSDARMLDANPSLMDSFRPSEDGNVLAASNRDFLSAFIQGTGATAELTTSEGYNVKALTLRVKNAVLAALIGPENRDLISNLTERAEELGVARVSAGILNIAPMLSKLQGTPHDLSPTLAKALADLVRIRSNNEKIGDFLSQQGLFGDPDRTNESDYLLAKLAEAKSAKAVSEPLQRYAKLASGQDTTTEDIFGGGISTPAELLKSSYENQGTSEAQTDLSFGKSPSRVEEPKSTAQNAGDGVSGKTAAEEVASEANKARPVGEGKILFLYADLSSGKQAWAKDTAEFRKLTGLSEAKPIRVASGDEKAPEGFSKTGSLANDFIKKDESALGSNTVKAEKPDRQERIATIKEIAELSDVDLSKNPLLYVVSDATGEPIEVFQDEQTANEHMSSMAAKGEWLWRVPSNYTSPERLLGGVPAGKAQPKQQGPVGLYGTPPDTRAQTSAKAGEIPLYSPLGNRFKGSQRGITIHDGYASPNEPALSIDKPTQQEQSKSNATSQKTSETVQPAGNGGIEEAQRTARGEHDAEAESRLSTIPGELEKNAVGEMGVSQGEKAASDSREGVKAEIEKAIDSLGEVFTKAGITTVIHDGPDVVGTRTNPVTGQTIFDLGQLTEGVQWVKEIGHSVPGVIKGIVFHEGTHATHIGAVGSDNITDRVRKLTLLMTPESLDLYVSYGGITRNDSMAAEHIAQLVQYRMTGEIQEEHMGKFTPEEIAYFKQVLSMPQPAEIESEARMVQAFMEGAIADKGKDQNLANENKSASDNRGVEQTEKAGEIQPGSREVGAGAERERPPVESSGADGGSKPPVTRTAAAAEPEDGGSFGANTPFKKVIEKMTPGLEILRDMKQGIQSLMLPTAKSPEHLKAAEELGARLGESYRRAEVSRELFKKDSLTFEKLGVHREDMPIDKNPGIKFMSDMSTGRAMTPEMQKIADKDKAESQKRLDLLEKAGVPLQNIRENYFKGIWTNESRLAFNLAMEEARKAGIIPEGISVNTATGAQKAWVKARVDEYLEGKKGSDKDQLSFLTRNPLKGKESFRKRKVFDEDIATAFEFGLRAVSNNPIDIFMLKYAEMDKNIMANQALRQWERQGDVTTQEGLFIAPDETFARIDDKYGTIWGGNSIPVWKMLQALAKTAKRDMYFADFGKEVFADPDLKDEVNALRWTVDDGTELNIHAMHKGTGRSYSQLIVENMLQDHEAFQDTAPALYSKLEEIANDSEKMQQIMDLQTFNDLKAKLPVEGRIIKGYRYAKKPVADILNNYLSSTLYNNPYFGTAYKLWMAFANLMNQTQLGLGSLFHVGFSTLESQVSAGADLLLDIYGLARGNRSMGDVLASLKHVGTATVETGLTGDKIINAWRNPDGKMDPRIEQVARAWELGGGRFRMEKGLRTDQISALTRDWFNGHKLRAAMRSPVALVELFAKPTLDLIVPRQKAGVFAYRAWRIIDMNPGKTMEELTPQFRAAVNRIEARLGQVGYERLFINNVAKNVMQMLIRSVGWTGGTIAELGGSLKDTGTYFKEWHKTGKAPKDMPDRVAYTLSLLISAAVINGVLTYLLSGKKPEGMDYWAFKTGTKDDSGKDERFMLPMYTKDLLAYWEAPGTTLSHKMHPALSIMSDLYRNQDYYGVQIADPDANIAMRAAQKSKYVLKAFEPFWIRGAKKNAQAGDSLGKMALPLIGIMPAPSSITKSAAEKQASEINKARMPASPITEQEQERRIAKSQLVQQVRKGDRSGIAPALAAKTIQPKDVPQILNKARMTPLQSSVNTMSLDQVKKVSSVATPEEKRQLAPILARKAQTAYRPGNF